jgi:ketosteroid isomerase-like protein
MTDNPSATVTRFVDAFNRLDVAEMSATFAVPSFILDGMAPHVWSGPTAAADWCRDALAEADHLGISDFHVTLDAPLHDVATGEAAYFVAPATMRFKVGGQPVTQSGATLTIALKREDGRWLISAWAWTKGAGGGVDDARTG